jgi:VCBS repeat-containing protein
MLRSGFLALAACALSAMLSACGGGSDDDEPVAGTSNVSVVEDTPLTFALADGDPNGDELTATIVTPPTKGDVVFAGSNPVRFTYTPHPNENGLDAFTYQLSDGNKTSNLGTVNIGINPVNDVPAIQPTATTDEDVTLTATLIVDADGDTFTSEIVTPPSHGTLTVDASNPGKFTYVPEADFNGEDSVELKASYTAADSTTATVTGTVVITVRPVDDPPVAVADAVRTV